MQIVRSGHLRDKGGCGNAGETRVEIALCIIPYDAVKRECGSQGQQYIQVKNTEIVCCCLEIADCQFK